MNLHRNIHFPVVRVSGVIPIILMGSFLLEIGLAMLSPIFAIFVSNDIENGSVEVVGFSLALFWITKSLLQLPIARYVDKNHGEIDDYYFLVSGMIASSFTLFGFSLAAEVWQVYVLHILLGASTAMFVPPFYAMFTRHIDKGNESFEWSLYSSFALGGGSALGGALGGIFVGAFWFRNVFVIASIFNFAAAIVLLLMKPYIIPKSIHPVERMPMEQRKI